MKKFISTFGLTALVVLLTSFTSPEAATIVVDKTNNSEIVNGRGVFSTKKLDVQDGRGVFSTKKLDVLDERGVFSTKKLDVVNRGVFSTKKLD